VTVEQLKIAYEAAPFRPFVLHLADGRDLLVRGREFISFSPSGRTVVVHQLDESYNVVDLLLVTDLEFKNGRRRSVAAQK